MKFTSRPPTTISPESASSSPATTRRIVLLPQPEGPRRTRNSPSAICSETSLTASTLPKLFVRCLIRISATSPLLLERACHRRLHEPALEDQKDDDHRAHRHHCGGGNDAPVGHELSLQRRYPDRERLHVVGRRDHERPEEVHPLVHEREDAEHDDRRLHQRQHDLAEDLPLACSGEPGRR